ncbi:MAG: hypothetical protein P8Y30_07160 [candidate division WOR-3 bacterium]
MITIDETYLFHVERRRAEHLAALAEYRSLAAQLAAGKSVSLTAIDAADQRLAGIESDEEYIRSLMVTAADAAERLGYSRAQMTRICRECGPGGDNRRNRPSFDPGMQGYYRLLFFDER